MFLKKILENNEVKNYINEHEDILNNKEINKIVNESYKTILDYCKENIKEFMTSDNDLESTYEGIKSFAKEKQQDVIEEINSIISDDKLTQEEKTEELEELRNDLMEAESIDDLKNLEERMSGGEKLATTWGVITAFSVIGLPILPTVLTTIGIRHSIKGIQGKRTDKAIKKFYTKYGADRELEKLTDSAKNCIKKNDGDKEGVLNCYVKFYDEASSFIKNANVNDKSLQRSRKSTLKKISKRTEWLKKLIDNKIKDVG